MHAELVADNALVHVVAPDRVHDEIWGALSYYEKTQSGYGKMRSEIRSVYDRRKKYFQLGLLKEVVSHLRKKGVGYSISDCRNLPRIDPSGRSYDLPGVNLYDFQVGAIEAFLERKRGVIQLPTGAGKTLVAKGITKYLNVPTLFLTHRLNLVTQTARRFQNRLPEYKGQFGIITGKENSPNFITFATVQTLHSELKRNPGVRKLLEKFELLIVDEAHRIKSAQFVEVANACRNAYCRCALTATPNMRGDDVERFNLQGAFGDVVYRVTASDLIARGLLARPYFKFLETGVDPSTMYRFKNYRDIYENGIVNCHARNLKVVGSTEKLIEAGHTVLVVVLETKHGEILKTMFSKIGIQAAFCSGTTSAEDREHELEKLEKGKSKILICSTIFDEGIDISGISAIVLAGGGKSAPMLFQRIGRAIRRKEEENKAIIIDFIDRQHSILERHSQCRYNLVKAEKEFRIL